MDSRVTTHRVFRRNKLGWNGIARKADLQFTSSYVHFSSSYFHFTSLYDTRVARPPQCPIPVRCSDRSCHRVMIRPRHLKLVRQNFHGFGLSARQYDKSSRHSAYPTNPEQHTLHDFLLAVRP
jgi:hypothetical protein